MFAVEVSMLATTSRTVSRLMRVSDTPEHKAQPSWKQDDVAEVIKDDYTWQLLSTFDQVVYIITCFIRLFAILLILFIYICALNNLSNASGLLGSRGLGKMIEESPLINDPISAVVVGMLATVVLQSATTTISVLVGMVAADMLTVHDAIPVMIGSELGSSLVNALVSLAYSGEREQFQRAFSAATLGDVFNVCCLFVILPLELITGFIEKISWWIVDPLIAEQGIQFKTLELLTDPLNNLILQVNDAEIRNATVNDAYFPSDHSFIMRCIFVNGSRIFPCPYNHLFAYSELSDATIAWIILIASIIVLIFCLVAIVYLIQALLDGHAAIWVRRQMERKCPGRWKPLTGYTVMCVGLVLTLLIQSNSIFSSSLTPLVGSGVISLEQTYPLLLGSNIGATFSGVLAALSADGTRFEKTLHMAVCQVMYNVIGTFMFYIIPCTRRIPIHLARKLGATVDQYRWFIVVFIFNFFILIPAVIVALSLAPPIVILTVFFFILLAVAFIVIVNTLQGLCPESLPAMLQNWNFVPIQLRSLEPYDECMTNFFTSLPVIGTFFEKIPPVISSPINNISEHVRKFSRQTQV